MGDITDIKIEAKTELEAILRKLPTMTPAERRMASDDIEDLIFILELLKLEPEERNRVFLQRFLELDEIEAQTLIEEIDKREAERATPPANGSSPEGHIS